MQLSAGEIAAEINAFVARKGFRPGGGGRFPPRAGAPGRAATGQISAKWWTTWREGNRPASEGESGG